MIPLPEFATDRDLLAFVDGWVKLLESENYDAAYAYMEHSPDNNVTAESIRSLIKRRGNERVTFAGTGGERQNKRVFRNAFPPLGCDIEYDLFINGELTGLTAKFFVVARNDGLVVWFHDIVAG